MTLTTIQSTPRDWLRIYIRASAVTGWLLIAAGLASMLFGIYLFFFDANIFHAFPSVGHGVVFLELIMSLADWFVPGLFALLAARLLHFICGEGECPGWLLLHGEVILYATLPILGLRFAHIIIIWHERSHNPEPVHLIAHALLSALYFLAPVLLALILARLIRRLLPIITESKAMV